jgi:allantoicase
MAQDPLALPDLAVRSFGGAVVWANDELFAGRENLVTPGAAVFTPRTFGAKGQVYDGWETRRRRDLAAGDADQAIVRLGAPGVVRAVVVDTSHFTGNFPTEASVDGVALDGVPSVDALRAADWTPLVERSALKGDTANVFPVGSPRRWTHVRLNIFPDGGVARLRLYGSLTDDGLAAARRRWDETA